MWGYNQPFGYRRRNNIIVFDSFNRPDNPDSLGIADTGQSWELIQGGVMGIIDNKAYGSDLTSYPRSVVETGVANCILNATIEPDCLITFRVQDAQNRLSLGISAETGYILNKVRNGGVVHIGSWGVGALIGDKVSILLVGSAIKVYVNNVLRISVIESEFITNTKHGIGGDSPSGRIDNFKVEAL